MEFVMVLLAVLCGGLAAVIGWPVAVALWLAAELVLRTIAVVVLIGVALACLQVASVTSFADRARPRQRVS